MAVRGNNGQRGHQARYDELQVELITSRLMLENAQQRSAQAMQSLNDARRETASAIRRIEDLERALAGLAMGEENHQAEQNNEARRAGGGRGGIQVGNMVEILPRSSNGRDPAAPWIGREALVVHVTMEYVFLLVPGRRSSLKRSKNNVRLVGN